MNTHSSTLPPSDDQLPSLRELLYVVLLRRRVVAGVFLSVMAGAAILVFGILSPKYEASATVLINVAQVAMPITDGAPVSDLEKLSSFQTQKDIIKSVVVSRAVVDQLNLKDSHVLSNVEKLQRVLRGIRRAVGEILGIASWSRAEDPYGMAIEAVNTRLEIISKPESQALKITYRAYDAKEAEETLRAVIDQYSSYYYAHFQERAQGMRGYLEARLQDADRNLAASEAAILDFRKRDRVDLSGLRSGQPAGEPGGMTDPSRPGLVGLTDNVQVQTEMKLSILSMEQELRKLSALYSDAHPDIQNLQARIKRYVAALNSLPNKEVEWLKLKRELEANQEVVLGLRRGLERSRMFAENSTHEIQVIQVVDPAGVEDEPVSPKPKLSMLIALACGLVFSVMSAFILDYLDPTIRSVREAERSIGVRVLGSMNRM